MNKTLIHRMENLWLLNGLYKRESLEIEADLKDWNESNNNILSFKSSYAKIDFYMCMLKIEDNYTSISDLEGYSPSLRNRLKNLEVITTFNIDLPPFYESDGKNVKFELIVIQPDTKYGVRMNLSEYISDLEYTKASRDLNMLLKQLVEYYNSVRDFLHYVDENTEKKRDEITLDDYYDFLDEKSKSEYTDTEYDYDEDYYIDDEYY